MTEQIVREVDATPYAASLIEGHRDFGYNLETALADIIDNAITAGARTVVLIADTVADEPWIALADDGSGMTETELVEAMRLGSKNPTDERRGRRPRSFRPRPQERQLLAVPKSDGSDAARRLHILCALGLGSSRETERLEPRTHRQLRIRDWA